MSAAFSLKDRACIVGVGQSEFSRPKGAGKSSLVLQLEAASAALADAGLTHKDVDGILPFPNLATAEELAANLGVENLRFATTLQMGGAAPVASLAVAAMAVSSGAADVGMTDEDLALELALRYPRTLAARHYGNIVSLCCDSDVSSGRAAVA